VPDLTSDFNHRAVRSIPARGVNNRPAAIILGVMSCRARARALARVSPVIYRRSRKRFGRNVVTRAPRLDVGVAGNEEVAARSRERRACRESIRSSRPSPVSLSLSHPADLTCNIFSLPFLVTRDFSASRAVPVAGNHYSIPGTLPAMARDILISFHGGWLSSRARRRRWRRRRRRRRQSVTAIRNVLRDIDLRGSPVH